MATVDEIARRALSRIREEVSGDVWGRKLEVLQIIIEAIEAGVEEGKSQKNRGPRADRRLTDAQISEIRKSSASCKDSAARYGVAPNLIWKIRKLIIYRERLSAQE